MSNRTKRLQHHFTSCAFTKCINNAIQKLPDVTDSEVKEVEDTVSQPPWAYVFSVS